MATTLRRNRCRACTWGAGGCWSNNDDTVHFLFCSFIQFQRKRSRPVKQDFLQYKITNWRISRDSIHALLVGPNGSPIRSVTIRISKIGQPRSRSPIFQSWEWLQTKLDDTKSCYHNRYNFRKKKTSRTNISGTDNVWSKKFLHFENSLFCFQDKWLLLWLLWSILGLMDLAEWTSVWFSDQRCPITTNCPITLSYHNCTEWLVENKAANAPITSGNCNGFDYDEYATVFSYSDYFYFHAW